jgi:lipoate-protein ligase A
MWSAPDAADETPDLRTAAAGPLVRWWVAARPAIVVGLGLSQRLADILDFDACRRAGVDVLTRRAGGGAVLVDEHMICGAICVPLPDPRIGADLTESYRWLGDALLADLRDRGVSAAHRVEVVDARADVAALRARPAEPLARLILATCYGALSPHEIAVGRAKLVGLAQVRRRHAALFQVGILRQNQARFADFLRAPDEATRAALRAELARRTVGLEELR